MRDLTATEYFIALLFVARHFSDHDRNHGATNSSMTGPFTARVRRVRLSDVTARQLSTWEISGASADAVDAS